MEQGTMELFTIPKLNITNCVTVTLTQNNYILWKSQFESFLSGQGLLGFVNGAFPSPGHTIVIPGINGRASEITNPDFQAWQRTDQVVKSWLLGSFSEDILSVVVNCNTAHEVWLTLANHFNRASSSRLFELQRKLQVVSKGEKTMSEYLKEVKTVCDQLASIGSPVPENMKVFAALHGLSKDYEPIITNIEGSMDVYPHPTFDDVVPRLTSYEDRIKSYETATVTPHLAFNVARSNTNSGYYNNRGRGQTNARFGGNRGRASFSTRGRGFYQQLSPYQGSSTASETDERPTCQICGKPGHQALRCWHRFNNSYQDENVTAALTAMKITDVSDHSGHEWYPDTGATSHVTNSISHLSQAQPYRGNDAVLVGDGNYLPITHVGSANLPSASGQGNQTVADPRKKL